MRHVGCPDRPQSEQVTKSSGLPVLLFSLASPKQKSQYRALGSSGAFVLFVVDAFVFDVFVVVVVAVAAVDAAELLLLLLLLLELLLVVFVVPVVVLLFACSAVAIVDDDDDVIVVVVVVPADGRMLFTTLLELLPLSVKFVSKLSSIFEDEDSL